MELNINRCFVGVKAESLAVALAMPKYELDQLALIHAQPFQNINESRKPFSRRYLTYYDKVFWNTFLMLFSPKEIDLIDPYLEPLPIYMRSSDNVVRIGNPSWYSNIDIFFKKKFIHFKKTTWDMFRDMSAADIDQQFQSWCDVMVNNSFYKENTFSEMYKSWLSKRSSLVTFFKLFIEDWLIFFQTDQGMKLWQIIPALYRIKIERYPSELKVAELIFNMIQPHFFFDEKKFNEDVSNYLKDNQSYMPTSNKNKIVEEANKILHIVNETNKPIRSEKYWEFPSMDFKPTSGGIVYWSWQTPLSNDQLSAIEKKIIIDLNDFIIDQYYFSATIAFVDYQYELMFLQKTQNLYAKQLEKKLVLHFQDILQTDDFWSTWHDFSIDLSSIPFTGPTLDCSFVYSDVKSTQEYIKWIKGTNSANLHNHRVFNIISENNSYWTNYLYKITRILWLELYDASF